MTEYVSDLFIHPSRENNVSQTSSQVRGLTVNKQDPNTNQIHFETLSVIRRSAGSKENW